MDEPPRETPVQAIAHLLPCNDPFAVPIAARFRVPLGSRPEDLLTQFDKPKGHWAVLSLPPEFPKAYPPHLPTLRDVDMLRLAFTAGKNARLEWLGDAVVGAAIALATHEHFPDLITDPPGVIMETLASGPCLARLALLYGLQLHATDLTTLRLGPRASIETICDVFEAFVAAVALDLGFSFTLGWLVKLFQPWVAHYATQSESGNFAGVRRRYKSCLRTFAGVPVAQMSCRGVNVQALAAFGEPRVGWPEPNISRVRNLLATPRPKWISLGAIPLEFDEAYPPPPPHFRPSDGKVLTDALTSAFCHFHFGDSVVGNWRYRSLGHRLYSLAVSYAAYKLLPLNSDELDDIRMECFDETVLAWLAAILLLDKHMRVLRPEGDETNYVAASQCAEAFTAFIAAVYLRRRDMRNNIDWDPLINWLEPLLTPWIVAAANGTLRISSTAQVRREDRRLKREKRLIARKEREERNRLERLWRKIT